MIALTGNVTVQVKTTVVGAGTCHCELDAYAVGNFAVCVRSPEGNVADGVTCSISQVLVFTDQYTTWPYVVEPVSVTCKLSANQPQTDIAKTAQTEEMTKTKTANS